MTGPIMVDIEGLELCAEDHQILGHPLTGGVILFSRNYANPDQVRDLIRSIHAIKTPSLIVAVDQEGGRVQRFLDGFTRIPPMKQLGVLYDQNPIQALQFTQDIGWLMASELRDVGIDLNFAPVIDLDHGCSEVIGDRAFHANADTVTQLASALIGGHHAAGVSTCVKHFPGHGGVTADSHHELPEDQRTRRQVDHDLLPFQTLMLKPLDSVMTAHVVVTCEDACPVSFSARWLQQILRTEFGFDGIVFSDDLSMKGADIRGGIVKKVQKAHEAGCQFLPICNDREAVKTLYAANPAYLKPVNFERLRASLEINKNTKKSARYEITKERLQRLTEAG